MRILLFFSLALSVLCNGQDPNAIHPFTDVNGRTLQAKYIGSSADSVKIEWNGQTFELPLITLDGETQSLVDRLSKVTAPSDSSEEVQKWTDTQGRTIEAKFVKADKLTLTIDWNGKVTTLPLTMFSASSRKLAAELQNQQTQSESVNAPAPKIDLAGEMDLSKEYPWQNTSGQTAYGSFVELGKSDLKILMSRGTREVAIPIDSLNKDSLALDKKLQTLATAEQKGLAALAKKRKAMKVPAVTEADLEIEHDFTNTSGQVVKAQFVDADDKMISLLMARRSKTPFKLAWTSFADESVAKLEALRRKRVEVDNAKPKIIAAKGNRLSYYGSGKYKGYNTVFDTENYAVAMNHPKRRMALIFRWYLGLSSRWSNHGEAGRETDYQIWCGPAMGAFNAWVKGSFLEEPSNRRVVDIAENLMQGAAYLFRLQQLKTQGIHLPSSLFHFTPVPSA